MKRATIGFCATLLTFSAAMIGSAVAVNPERAEAYMSDTYNYTFNGVTTLPNGYRVGIIGVGYQKQTVFDLFTSANVGVQVMRIKSSKSQLKSVRLIHQTSGYTLKALNISSPIQSFKSDMVATCNGSETIDCTLHRGNTITGATFAPNVSVRAEITFNDGVYMVQSNQVKTAQ